MSKLKQLVDKLEPTFSEGGKLASLHSVFDGFKTFLYVPNHTSKTGTHIHDAIDSKRTMILVVIALIPALLFGMYNVGFQHFAAIGQLETASFWTRFFYGFLAILPSIVVSYAVGLGIEFAIAQVKGHEIQEGFLVSGFLIPMIIPVDTPLWMTALATAFAVIFAKEIFGGTGYNIFNVALITRAFLFFSYPIAMSGDKVWVRLGDTFGWAGGEHIDGFTGATALGQLATAKDATVHITDSVGDSISALDGFIGLIPGSIGETSTIAILIGAALLLITGIASYRVILSVFAGGALIGLLFNVIGPDTAIAALPWYEHLVLGGFAFGAVFMATDPVTSPRTKRAQWVYGFLIGAMAITIRVLNPGYPEGMMLAILLMNVFGCLFDYLVVEKNIKKRLNRATSKK